MVESIVEGDVETSGMVVEGMKESGCMMVDWRQVVVRGKRCIFHLLTQPQTHVASNSKGKK
jgi:hypothetical protein